VRPYGSSSLIKRNSNCERRFLSCFSVSLGLRGIVSNFEGGGEPSSTIVMESVVCFGEDRNG